MDFVAGLSAAAEPRENSIPDRTVHPFLWSVRRELWENRSVWLVPIIVGIVEVVGFAFSAIGLPERRRAVLLLDIAQQRARIEPPYNIAAVMMMFSALMVGLFYCADALHSERRDRSILFWKSLPVSDVTTVLSKVIIPLAILPAIVFVIIPVTQFLMLLISSVVLLPSGLAGTTWANFNLFRESIVLLYGLVVIVLWHAPIYGWALLISGIGRRATFLWAVMPPLALAIFEKITFNTSYVWSMLKHRLLGAGDTAFDFQMHRSISVDLMSQLTPGRFLATPGLWIGLIFAAVFVMAAIRLRRYRGPL